MSDVVPQFLESAFGSTGSLDALTFEHMMVRAVVIYCIGLVIIRIGKNRLLGRTTGFDIVLAFILDPPRILEVDVQGGVQTVRIEVMP